jgi:7-cyano-7-deazaguanine reductase
VHQNPLGQQTEYVSEYAPQLLFPIARIASRKQLGVGVELPFFGVDIWTGYELSWLGPQGKPVVAVAEFYVPCDSHSIVESKSFKLYLNSLNQSKFTSSAEVEALLARDLTAAAGGAVTVKLYPLAQMNSLAAIASLPGCCVDDLDVAIDTYHPAPELLLVDKSIQVSEALHSHLLKTNCPVTGQPDWASLVIEYRGSKIQAEGLLRYIVSFREHQDFHEHCVERIFMDLMAQCAPEALSVYARYTRRGGLDINPLRTTAAQFDIPSLRLIRQ